jgi:hypothetical protein
MGKPRYNSKSIWVRGIKLLVSLSADSPTGMGYKRLQVVLVISEALAPTEAANILKSFKFGVGFRTRFVPELKQKSSGKTSVDSFGGNGPT